MSQVFVFFGVGPVRHGELSTDATGAYRRFQSDHGPGWDYIPPSAIYETADVLAAKLRADAARLLADAAALDAQPISGID